MRTDNNSLEEDNSDFSSDSLECQKEREHETRSLVASEKHQKEGSCSVKKKAEGISEKETPKEYRNTETRTNKIPFYKREVNLTDIEKVLENDCKGDAEIKAAYMTKERKRLVNDLFKKDCLSHKNDYKEDKYFLSQWLIQANAYNNSRRMKESQMISEETLRGLMKCLSFEDCPNESSSRISATKSGISLRSGRKKNHILDNKVNYTRKREPVSYLKKYLEKKYGLYKIKGRPLPEGSLCSTYDDSSSLSIIDEDDQTNFDSECKEDEYSFYMKIIENAHEDSTSENCISNSENTPSKPTKVRIDLNVTIFYSFLFSFIPWFGQYCLLRHN